MKKHVKHYANVYNSTRFVGTLLYRRNAYRPLSGYNGEGFLRKENNSRQRKKKYKKDRKN